MSLDEWWTGVDRHEKDEHLGYRQFVEWWRGKCYPTMSTLEEAYATFLKGDG